MRGGFAMALLAATGLLSTSLGLISLSTLAVSYRQSDIALTESPATFQVWLSETALEGTGAATDISERVASRLLAMPLEKRRDLVASLVQREFWMPLTKERETPRALQQATLDGVIEALHKAPMAGDLYLAAAWIEIRTAGFGSRARELLKASHIFAPRELPLIGDRGSGI